ncbi:PREDICTED: beta-secretase 2 isoform X1 [Nanorana parkeri]|uniref:beta-secretase 2 isoform X1 n=1 Tax=Nanorana parkeri TaxID=125878 RepID=UPI000853FA3B|nr:PREDICTED: beta-secretase 2 isoform X1 [Nanorana parkeri]
MRGALQTLTLLALLGGARTMFSIPLRISPALVSQPQSVSTTTAKDIMGLALASDPSGKINFMTMVNNLEGDSGRGYYLEMLIGTPPQPLNILVDTGSSNFAVAAAPNPDISKYYKSANSSTFQPLGVEVTVRYTQGSWTGVLGKDVIGVPKGVNGTFLVNIASILESESFFMPQINWQGILGLAYSTLAKPSSSVETFFDSLVKQAAIPDIFSMQMCGAGLPTTGAGINGGSLVMGGIESMLYSGDIWYTAITEEWYYQVEVLKFEVGGMNLNLDCTEYNTDKAIVDSGTTLLRLPDKVFNAMVEAIIQTSLIQNFNTEFWTGMQLACWEKTEEPWAYFPDLSIYLRDNDNASLSFRLTMKPQLYIQSVMTFREDMNCYRFGISPSSNALVIGATVMEGFYVIFDRADKKVGFAVSTCAEVNGVRVSEITGPFSTKDVSSNCITTNPFREPIMWIISYALMTFCGIILLVLVVLLLIPNRRNDGPEVVNDESSLVRHRWK